MKSRSLCRIKKVLYKRWIKQAGKASKGLPGKNKQEGFP
jgi:hypothetical protein